MSDASEIIVGIDLGTTNSEIAAFVNGKPQVIGNGTSDMLPSCVGLTPTGELLIGEAARNQMLLYPERTVRSVKRLMGSNQSVTLSDKTYAPAEISALILRELARWAQAKLGQPVTKAVITVPAYFSDAQRQATREAGALAGLEVVRIINEPTAASLAYGLDADARRRTVMVYDLGGGTFDVAIVRIEGDVTEVLASHGNNRLGGDDFDEKLVDHLLAKFREAHDVDLRDRNPGAYARLWWAAESAKKQLSVAPFAKVVEESLIVVDGRPLHLDIEVTRAEYEAMIRPLLEQTLDSASKALTDAGLVPGALDEILLVGGSTRTPLVVEMLETLCHKTPRQDLHPDLCVALGAGVLASRIGGHDVQRVLVDVSPFSFGISHLGERDGQMYPHCYGPIIKRNTPLPVTRTEEYFTAADFQTAVELDVYQGDDPDALRNVHVGHFRIEGMRSIAGPNTMLCRMRLDLDGILHVTAIEKDTGLSKHVAISGATRRRDSTEITRGREELARLFATRAVDESEAVDPGDADLDEVMPLDASEIEDLDATDDADADADAGHAPLDAEVVGVPSDVQPAAMPGGSASPSALIERTRTRLETLHADDRGEAEQLIAQLTAAVGQNDDAAVAAATKQLSEFLFFIEAQ